MTDLSNATIVNIEECYCDNTGPYSLATVLKINTIHHSIFANGHDGLSHDGLSHDAYKVNCTDEERLIAASIFALECHGKLIGSIVTLKGSRKAPNKVPVLVIGTQESYYDDTYRQHVDAKIQIRHDGNDIWVAKTCLSEVKRGPLPYWAKV